MKWLLVFLLVLSACSGAPQGRPYRPTLIRPVIPKVKVTATDPNALNSLPLEIPEFSCIPAANGAAVNNNQYVDWVNSGAPIEVAADWIWIGAASPGGTNSAWLGGILDVPFLLQDITTGALFAWSNQDRYAPAPGISDDLFFTNWAPNHILVNQGDTVRFTIGCAGPYSVDNLPVSVQGLAVLQYLQ